ncbi:MBL fold metallo-hydrolase [Paremcibacter congregatus]|uniref:MBL fold metallo-hydrolase n=1 Tax=Paremcibacter congregatus TaxID=2043170 RepID=A0A2G4YSF7_9PROT|nr:MBL fold metallo-hydrolase [Paremcibacter congregatus]PHZ85197.1 MBL fold metallo-hydrolase [Paremcibacter congregatus]QDE27869.1 MBL fold metallo-hydrolase [Paremcibacter congregatus]
MSVRIKFCGAAGTVTGSCYWIRAGKYQFLVDCGLFQGSKSVKELNYKAFPFDASRIDFVLLTHAHADHSALLPKLMKAGFRGPIYTITATRDLIRYMLPDSGYIQEFEVSRLNRRNQQRGRARVEPIYTQADAEAVMHQVRCTDYETWIEPEPDVRARFWNAGHILGSASIEVEIIDKGDTLKLLFSGDLGPDNKLFHDSPDAPQDFDYVFCESTYGGRNRPDISVEERRSILAKEINEAMATGGNMVIPSFALERSQELLLDIAYLLRHDVINSTAVFLDSPLAIKITSVFTDHAKELNNAYDGGAPFSHPRFHFTETVEESKSISRFHGGVIILAASGMCDAGRIRHHLRNHLWNPQSTVLLSGYQVVGTLGNLLESGVKQVKIQGEEIEVRARIRSLDHYSGHADSENLIDWVMARAPIRQGLFLTHGSDGALHEMQRALRQQGMESDKVIIPAMDDEFLLEKAKKPRRIHKVVRRLSLDLVDRTDWHNAYAQLTLDIRNKLEKAPNNRQREILLHELHKALSVDVSKETSGR